MKKQVSIYLTQELYDALQKESKAGVNVYIRDILFRKMIKKGYKFTYDIQQHGKARCKNQ